MFMGRKSKNSFIATCHFSVGRCALFFGGLLCICLSGCGELNKASDDVKTATRNTKNNLKRIQQRGTVDMQVLPKLLAILDSYAAYDQSHGNGPMNWQQLIEGAGLVNSEMGGEATQLREAKREGYEIVFGQPLSKYVSVDDAFHVLAFQKNTIHSSGWVLFGDGEIMKISSKEFTELSKLGDRPPKKTP